VDIKELIVSTTFLDEIKQPIFVKDRSGVYVYCNESFSNFIGVPIKKIISYTAYDIAPQALANVYSEADKLLFETANRQDYISKVKKQNSSDEVKVIFKKSVFYNHQNELTGFIGTIENHANLVHQEISIANKLTEREVETLNLLAHGKSVKQIAGLLMISPHTVTDYMKSIYLKLDVHSKNEAIYKALTFWSSKND
jgi:DNA-binding NarL/FixJ family response regulator